MNINFFFTFGIVCGLAMVAFLMWLFKKVLGKEEFIAKYDERQNAARGTAFKWAFYVMLAGVVIDYLYRLITMDHFQIDPIYTDLLLLIVGLLVYATVSIWKNAYVGINQTVKKSTWLLMAIGVMNVGIGIMNMGLGRASGPNATYAWINLALGVMLVIVCGEMLLKNYLDKKHADDEDDEE